MKIYMQSYKEKLDFIEKSISSTRNETEKNYQRGFWLDINTITNIC